LKSAKLPTQGIAIRKSSELITTTPTFTTTTAATTITAASTRPKEERLAREKAQQIEEFNIAWDDVQAKIEDDYKLAQRLQAQEQKESTDEEKARLFV
ncbi:hypothetical protein Tco_0560150, partial [Tanacetum coccineum]